jgi:hypothetical protein
MVLGSQEHVPNLAEHDAPWLRHCTVPSSALGSVPNFVVDPIHSSAMEKTHVSAMWQLSALLRDVPNSVADPKKHPMALPQGSPQLSYEATHNSVAGPFRGSAANSVPSSTVGPKTN